MSFPDFEVLVRLHAAGGELPQFATVMRSSPVVVRRADRTRYHGAKIEYSQVSSYFDESMPCGGVWPADKIEIVQRWTDTGMKP